MKSVLKSIIDLSYMGLPCDHGQPERTVWAYDEDIDRLIRRTFEWDEKSVHRFSNLRFEYRSFSRGKHGVFDPLHGYVNPIGKGRGEGALKF